jgi:pimeloyl-ACP methyl ester carboxylesterase
MRRMTSQTATKNPSLFSATGSLLTKTLDFSPHSLPATRILPSDSISEAPVTAMESSHSQTTRYLAPSPTNTYSSSYRLDVIDLFNTKDDVQDLHFICTALASKNWIIHGIIGHSRGANVSLLYSSRFPTTARYTLPLSPRFNMVQGFRAKFAHTLDAPFNVNLRGKRGVRSFKVDWEETGRIDEDMKDVGWNIPVWHPVMVVHGTSDEVIPVQDAADLVSQFQHGNGQLRLVPSANHNYTSHSREIVDVVCGFAERFAVDLGLFWRCWGGRGRVFWEVEGVKNFRELGGYLTRDQRKTIKRGIVYRSAEYDLTHHVISLVWLIDLLVL